jgi:hypothetical protein
VALSCYFTDEGRMTMVRRPISFAVRPLILGLGLLAMIASQAMAQTGNGAPSGPHYNLNLIGVPRDKTADMDNNDGHRIFVKLEGNTKIFLFEGDDFDVLDANGTDRDGAAFQLPNPDPDGDGVTVYSVWARALGKPGGRAVVTTCAIDDAGEEVCSLESLVLVREKGKSSFTNVSRELLFIFADITDDGIFNPELIPLFDDRLQGFFWDFDNEGLKIVQLRFYPISTDVNN